MSILRTSATKSTSWSKSSAPANRASEAEGCQRQLRASGAAGAATERRRPAMEHGPTGSAHESKEASGWQGGGAERTGLLAVEKLEQLVHAIPRGLHVAAHSVTVAPRRDQLCRGCPSGPFFRTSFFFIRQRIRLYPTFLLFFALRRFQRQVAPCRSVRSREPRPSLQPHTPCQRTTH